jgi:hypothetical protein
MLSAACSGAQPKKVPRNRPPTSRTSSTLDLILACTAPEVTAHAHSLVVKAVRAVEDYTLDCERLGQILGRFSLAGASRTSRSAAKVHVDSAHERAVATVCQRRDDEAPAVAQVLIPVECLERRVQETSLTTGLRCVWSGA